MHLVVGSAQRPVSGETLCGDQHAIVTLEQSALLCLADGLGHGPAAHAAAEVACQHAREHADEPLEALMRGIDTALAGTRGAAVALMSLQLAAGRLRFASIGNVELRSLSLAKIGPPSQPGIVGQGVRKVRVWEYSLAEGDLLVLTSDGISTRFELQGLAHLTPQALAETLLAEHQRAHDDACCIVARVTSERGVA